MPRIDPDDNDLVVWKLDEASAPFVNSSTSTDIAAPGSAANLSSNGTIYTQRLGLLGNCVDLPGGDIGTRNNLRGASAFEPVYPITVSLWVYMRSYLNTGGDNYGLIISKVHNNAGWSIPYDAFDMYLGNTGDGQWYIQITTTVSGRVSNVSFSDKNKLPLCIWSHIGFTYDGSTLLGYMNGNLVLSQSVTGAINYGSHGDWCMGAIPGGSGNKQEPCMMIQDVRIANVVRPSSYFKQIYQAGYTFTTPAKRYYKLRAYDLGCSTPTPVTWTDTQISLANAPVFPCSGPYSEPEILETWFA